MVDRIGHYRIVAELGRGGMGVVYKAHEESLNRFVALKVLGEHLTEDPSHVERFLREAQSAARLNHPNIVQIYAVSQDEGRHYFAMEYVSGQSLQQILRARGTLDSIQTARIALQTASGLGAAHEQGIIHRDIKPANLIVDERGLVKIADFGLALMTAAVSRLTATGMFMGTPGYLSPEQCLDKNIDHRTDIYSLGVTMFEALSGKAPFTGDSPLALLRQIIDVEPPDLGDLNPDVDPELRDLVQRMMAKDRELRVASCAELSTELEAFLHSKGAAGSLVERLAASTSGGPPPPPPPPITQTEELDSGPTVAVSGDLQDPGAPPVTEPAAETDGPIVESVPLPAAPPGRGRNIAIAATLVVLFGLAAIVAGGVFAWRSGLFGIAGTAAKHDRGAEAPAVEAAADLKDSGIDESHSDAQAGEGGSTGVAVAGSADKAPGRQPAPPLADSTGPSVSPEGYSGRQASPNVAAPETDDSRGEPIPEPTQAVVPPEGTVVIVAGEQLLAGEAETYIERILARAGIPLVDQHAIPGVSGLIGSGEVPRPGEIQAMLEPYVRNLVMVRIEYLGERPLTYMGQRDVAFQARVTMVPIDVQTGQPLDQPSRFRVEYTHLNVDRVVEKEFRQPTFRVIDRIR
jgi:serine/threonine-protein kinase